MCPWISRHINFARSKFVVSREDTVDLKKFAAAEEPQNIESRATGSTSEVNAESTSWMKQS